MAVKAALPRAKRKSAKRDPASYSSQEIAEVAYALYIQRGRLDGYDRQDWFEAEQIVRKRRGSGS